MADKVSVVFSAQIGQLISGVDQVKEAIASIAAPVNAMASVFTGFGEAFAGAFAIGQVAEFVSQMEDLGTKTVRTAAMLGVSTTEAQQLGFIAKATGGDAESLALSMERLQVNLQKAQSGAGPAAQALQALGLSAKSLIGLPLEEQMNRIADAVSKFADGGNKTAIVIDLLGRNGAQMIPVLDKGRAGLEELRDSALAAGVVMSKETVDGLDRAGTAAVTLRASITGLGEAIVGRFSKQLIEASGSLTTFAADMAALVQTSHLGEAAIAELGAGARIAGANIASLALTAVYAITGQWGEAVKAWREGNAEILRIQKETDDQVLLNAAKLRLALAMGLKFGGGTTNDKPQAPAMEVPNKDALNASMAAAQEQIKAADEVYKQQAEKYSSDFKLHQISESEKTAATLAALDQRYNAELLGNSGEIALYAQGTAGYQKATDERKQLELKFQAERQKIIDQGMQEEAAKWRQTFSTIEGAFNSQLHGLLAGTTTWAAAMKSIMGDLVIKFIEGVEKMVGDWIAGEIAKTTATTVGAGSRAAAETASASVSIFAQIGSALAVITADAAKTFAGVFAFLAPAMGPAAAGPATASAGAVEASVGGIAGMDVGGYVLQSGLIVAHAGETVVPANVSTPYTGTQGGGAPNVTLNLSAFNPNGLQQLIRQMMPQLSAQLSAYQKGNPSSGWS